MMKPYLPRIMAECNHPALKSGGNPRFLEIKTIVDCLTRYILSLRDGWGDSKMLRKDRVRVIANE